MVKYNSYKASGIEWIGQIPTGWKVTRIKYLAQEKDSLFIDGDWIESNVITEYGIRYITTGNIKPGKYVEQGTGFISEDTFSKLNCTEVFEGDLLISRLNLPIGRACIIPNLRNRIITSVDNVILRPDEGINKQYLLFLFTSKEYFEHTELIARGATMQRISRGLLGNIKIPLPSINEQNVIASFLDKKTSQIDNLIEKKKQLISLLKEERTAIINNAVTKGIDPNAKFKDSGIKWIGEVPEHWKVSAIKYLARIQNGSTPNSSVDHYWDGNINWITTDDLGKLKSKYIQKSRRTITEDGYKSCGTNLAPIGSIVISTRAPIGHIGILNIEACTNQGCKTILPKAIDSMFCYYYFLNAKDILESMGNGSTFKELPTSSLKDFKVIVPSIEEQKEIAEYIDQKVSEIEQVISKTDREIELMQEYKIALISEVVTGKVDVRNEVLV